jgi:5'-nucleotidase
VLLLLSNDDGIDAPGLAALAVAAADFGEPWVCAPTTEQSAKSHSFTMHDPLRVRRLGERRFAVTGTPADAVYLAMHGLLPDRPALVLSGINRGSNLGTDIHYSGTVAAAREAASHDLPAVAFSLHVGDGPVAVLHWDTAIDIVRRIVPKVLAEGLPVGTLLNVNVPNLPVSDLKGIRAAPLSRRRYETTVKEGRDLRGEPYYWIGGPHAYFSGDPGGDGPLCLDGWVTLTPLGLDLTAHEAMPILRRWES